MTALKSLLGVLAIVGVYFLGTHYGVPHNNLGSVIQGSEYHATTTDTTFTGAAGNFKLIQTGSGTLGSVVITSSTAGTLNIYDGTTTVNGGLGGIYATTTLAKFPASTAAGTYTFDVIFTKGLIVELSPNIASTTITFR